MWKSERESFLVSEDRGAQNPKDYKITENIFIFFSLMWVSG